MTTKLFLPSAREKGKKGGKKKNPWSDSEGSDNISDLSDLDGGDKSSDVFIPRDTARRAAG